MCFTINKSICPSNILTQGMLQIVYKQTHAKKPTKLFLEHRESHHKTSIQLIKECYCEKYI